MVERVKNGKNGKIAPEKKCPRVPVWVRGGGVVNAIWAMPTWGWWQIERCFPYKLMWLKIHTHKARLFSNNVLTKTRSIALWRCVSAHCLPIILVCCSSTFSHLSSIHMRGMTRLIGSTDTGQRCVHSSVSQYLLRLKAAVLCKLRKKSKFSQIWDHFS